MTACLRPAIVFAAGVALSGCMMAGASDRAPPRPELVSAPDRISPPPEVAGAPQQTYPLPELINTPDRTSPIPELVRSDKAGEMNLFLYTDHERAAETAGRQGYNLSFPIDKRRQDQ